MAPTTQKNKADLEQFIDAFMEHMPKMIMEHEGQWTVFKSDTPLGFYGDLDEAYSAGLKAYGNVPMLIRQVSKEYVEYGRYGRPVMIPTVTDGNII